MSQLFNLFRVSSRALLVANNSSGGSLQRYAVPAIQRFSHSSASSSPYISHQFYSNDAYTSQLDRGASRAGQTASQNKDQQQDSSSSSSVHFHGSDQQSQASTKPLGATLSGSNPGMQGQYNKDEVFSKIRGAETDDLSASSDKNKKDFSSSSSSSSSSKNRQSQTRQFNEDENKDKDKDEKEDYDSDDDDRVKDVDKRRTHQFSEFNKNQSKNDWKMQQGDKSSSFNSNKDLNNKDFNQNNKNQQQSDEFYHSQIDAFNKEKSYGKKANYSEENPQSTKTYGSSSDRSQKYEGDRMFPSSSSSSSSSSSASKNYSSSDSPFTATYVGGDSSFQSDSSKDMDKSKSSSSSSSNSNRSSGDKKKDVDYYDTAQGIFQKDKEFTGNNRMDTNYGSDRMQQKQQQQQQSSSSGSSSSSFDSSDLPSGMGMTRKDMESQDPVNSAKERQQNAFHKEEDRSALKGDIGGAGGNFGSSSVVSSSVASKEAEQKKEFKKDKMDSDKDRDRDRDRDSKKDKDRSDRDRDRDSNKDYKKQSDKKEFDQSSSQQNAQSRQQPTHDLNEQLNDATIPHSQHSRDNQWRGP